MTTGRDESVVTGERFDLLRRLCKDQRLWPENELTRFIARRFGEMRQKDRHHLSVLEVGCGVGSNLWALAAEGFRTHGLDISGERIGIAEQVCKAFGVHGVQLAVSDIRQSGLPPASFAAVVDITMMQHLDAHDHEVALIEVRRLLVPNGWFFSYHLGSRTHGYERVFPTEPPATLITRDDYVRLIHAHGFAVHRCEWTQQSRSEGVLEYLVVDARKDGA